MTYLTDETGQVFILVIVSVLSAMIILLVAFLFYKVFKLDNQVSQAILALEQKFESLLKAINQENKAEYDVNFAQDKLIEKVTQEIGIKG